MDQKQCCLRQSISFRRTKGGWKSNTSSTPYPQQNFPMNSNHHPQLGPLVPRSKIDPNLIMQNRTGSLFDFH